MENGEVKERWCREEGELVMAANGGVTVFGL